MKIKITSDDKTATISLLPTSGKNNSIVVSLDELSSLIAELGSARVQMAANQPIAPLENQEIAAVFNTAWYVQHEPLTGCPLLSFHHPAYGPVGFLVPRDQVAEMLRLLSIQVASPTPQGSKRN